MRLFWRVVLVNGVVFAVGTALRVFSPIFVSAQPAQREAVAVLVGAVVLLAVNGPLIRWALAPIDLLQAAMAKSTC